MGSFFRLTPAPQALAFSATLCTLVNPVRRTGRADAARHSSRAGTALNSSAGVGRGCSAWLIPIITLLVADYALQNRFPDLPMSGRSLSRRKPGTAGHSSRAGTALNRPAGSGPHRPETVFCPRAGRNPVRKTRHAATPSRSQRRSNKQRVLRPSAPGGFGAPDSPSRISKHPLPARRENHSVSTFVKTVDFPLSAWRAEMNMLCPRAGGNPVQK